MSKVLPLNEQIGDHVSEVDDIELEESYYKLWEDDRL
jgi:hypothetical protein